MAWNVGRLPVGNAKEEKYSFEGVKNSEDVNVKDKKNKANSWDTSSSNSSRSRPASTPKKKQSDWDVSSECHETMVEPFNDQMNKECDDNWDSDVEHQESIDGAVPVREEPGKVPKPALVSSGSSNSLDFSVASEVERNSLFDMFSSVSGQKSKVPNKNSDEMQPLKGEEDSLLVEDLEEFLKDASGQRSQRSTARTGRDSNQSEGTAGDDTTIWMIPKTDNSRSTSTDSKLVTPSEREKLLALDSELFVKRAKSSSNISKPLGYPVVSCRSDHLGKLDGLTIDLKNLPITCEGPRSRQESIPEAKSEKKLNAFDQSGVYFTEYECRTMTTCSDASGRFPRARTRSDNEGEADEENNQRNETPRNTPEAGQTVDETPGNYDRVIAGPSNQTSLEVVSLPDIIGRFPKERQIKEKFSRRLTGTDGARPEMEVNIPPNPGMRKANDSWFLMDESGQYQMLTKEEVAILLNGRSADGVLQRHKEHFIRNTNLACDTLSQNGSLGGMLTRESIRNILRTEDTGGEGHDKKSIDLERKVENTLLYIQPGINQTASIRIIPVETEMIHIWRRNKDTGYFGKFYRSLLSSDVDLRLQISQDSVDTSNQKNPSEHHGVYLPRMTVDKQQNTVVEQDESVAVDNSTAKLSPVSDNSGNQNHCHGHHHCQQSTHVNDDSRNSNESNQMDNQAQDYSRLLIETRLIVDNLTNNFRILQNRLDGETNRSCALQDEINKLRQITKDTTDQLPSQDSSRETIVGQLETNTPPLSFTETRDQSAKENQKSEEADEVVLEAEVDGGSEVVPEESAQAPSQNDTITKENADLKRKLKEISMELEKYLASTTESDFFGEEDSELLTLRDQVCNLKLELENLKKSVRQEERQLRTENAVLRQELKRNTTALEEWITTGTNIFREVENLLYKLEEIGILTASNFDLNEIQNHHPENFSWFLNSFIRQITERLISAHGENLKNEKSLMSGKQYKVMSSTMADGLDKVKSECNRLMEQFRNGQSVPGEHIIEDYFAVIMEKASLLEEIKVIKTENEILLGNQTEHHEKLRETMISLKDSNIKIASLESAQILSDEEKSQMMKVLKAYEEQKAINDKEMEEKNSVVEALVAEKGEKVRELEIAREELQAIAEEMKNLEKSCRLKEDMLNQIKVENEQLLKMDEAKRNEIDMLNSEINELEMDKTQLESEITSTKLLMNQAHKEMTEYINHLETIINANQETLDRNKQKLKDNNQALSRLKTENEALNKQYQCEVKLYNKTKEELNICSEQLLNITGKQREMEEEKHELYEKFQILTSSEKKAMEALDSVTRECKCLQNENAALKERLEGYSKDRDESIKEQKDLINKYAMLSKELQKIQDKYRNVKSECNERANVIRYLEMMLKENMLEYNNKIAYLENNITHILDKIAACKNTMREKHIGVDAEVVELRQQLDATHQERKELENVIANYYSAVKHLECEIHNREREVDELNAKLSLDHKKWLESNGQNWFTEITDGQQETLDKKPSNLKMEQLQSKILIAENELSACRTKLQQNEVNHENEKKKMELIIADLKSELNKYQMRMDVMMKNISNCNKNLNSQSYEKRLFEDSKQKVHVMSEEIRAKDKKITEMNDLLDKFRNEVATKDNELEGLKMKNLSIADTMKNLQNHVEKMESALSANSRGTERHQREKNEITEKLLQSIKIIMEEKSARQSAELLAAEKEKNYKEKLEHLKNQLEMKVKSCVALTEEVEEKKKLVARLQQDMKKMKSEMAGLKTQVANHKKKNSPDRRNECCSPESPTIFQGTSLSKSNSLSQVRVKNFTPERLESCLRELKEIRDVNLMLRKSEGECQAKIVRLEDEIRDARLMIKELEGTVKLEKKSKKALKNMIVSAKMEIERCLQGKKILATVAEKILRYLDLDEVQCRPYMIVHRSNSSESYT
ncbi:hypothetical protein RUM44_007210 [Polyplax serrata]|uniref:Uncharacterized protein n=1 Tax=Polyplax serrata TaxID=468196 RepID=A0ABR1B023_POLSC